MAQWERGQVPETLLWVIWQQTENPRLGWVNSGLAEEPIDPFSK